MRSLTARDRRLRRLYGITEAIYKRMLKAQDGKCAICRKPPTGRALAVDHDHVDKRVRGLLCWLCNKHIVGRHHTGTLLRKAADYLDSGKDWRRVD